MCTSWWPIKSVLCENRKMETKKVIIGGSCIAVLVIVLIALFVILSHRGSTLTEPVPILGPIELPKAPHWDEERRSIYFVDVYQSNVHRYEPETGVHKVAKVGSEPMAFIIPIKDNPDKFMISYGRDLVLITWDGDSDKVSQLQRWCPIGDNVYRANEGKVSPSGALFVGSHSPFLPNGSVAMNEAALHVFYPNRTSKILLDRVTVANGMAWSRDCKKFYFIDSLAYTVESFSYNIHDDTLSNRMVLCDFRKENIPGVPDGMTIDSDDKLWVTSFNGHQVVHLDPETHSIIKRIQLDSLQVTSAVFAGNNLKDFYITSAKYNLTEEEKKRYPHAGYIYEAKDYEVSGRSSGVPFSLQ